MASSMAFESTCWFIVWVKGTYWIIWDNRSTITITKNLAFHGRTKNIDVQHNFIRKLIGDGKILQTFRGQNEQEADIFTKSLPKQSMNSSGYNWECVSLNQGGC